MLPQRACDAAAVPVLTHEEVVDVRSAAQRDDAAQTAVVFRDVMTEIGRGDPLRGRGGREGRQERLRFCCAGVFEEMMRQTRHQLTDGVRVFDGGGAKCQ